MTTLASDKLRVYGEAVVNDHGVVATDIIYRGAAVGLVAASGLARPLTAGDKFAGFATAKADNSTGSAGDIKVNVMTKGRVQLAVASVAATDLGKPVFASDDDTFVLTESTNTYIGRVVNYVSSGVAIVEFDAHTTAGGLFTALTDNSGGTAADTIAAIGGTYSQTEVRDAIASLAAKINTIAKLVK